MRTDLLDEIAAMAADNNGIITWAALRALGVSEGTITAWVRSGRLHRILPRAYLWKPSSTDWSPMAAIQAQQLRAVASHAAAAMLHRFDGVEWYRMDVTVPRNVRLRGKNVHRTDDLVVPEIVIVDGIRCTDEVRTLIDYASRNSPEAFRRDRHRQNDLVSEDWTPLRFVDSDVRYYGRRTAMRTHAELTRRRTRLVAPTSTFSR